MTNVSLIERFNKTLQERLTVLLKNERARGLNIHRALERIVRQYNHRSHGALGELASADVNYTNGGRLLTEQVKNVEEADRLSKKIIRPFKFNVGDYVRRAVKVSPFHKSYRGNYGEEVFFIGKKWRQSPRWDINF